MGGGGSFGLGWVDGLKYNGPEQHCGFSCRKSTVETAIESIAQPECEAPRRHAKNMTGWPRHAKNMHRLANDAVLSLEHRIDASCFPCAKSKAKPIGRG